MDNGHAQAALEGKEGAERARKDFAAGITINPFPTHGGGQRGAWDAQMEKLVNHRDCNAAGHDRSKCCWEHKLHLARWNRSHRGITSCSTCEADADVERANAVPRPCRRDSPITPKTETPHTRRNA